ncbi:LysR substrate-binding domain-containing protein [Microbacterium sp. P02]|uniref:LysR substrate-binding domain-containing protein n=1 Tax=Microbacterium sp. P02 TaxID=3366260 RepID=UPI003670F584
MAQSGSSRGRGRDYAGRRPAKASGPTGRPRKGGAAQPGAKPVRSASASITGPDVKPAAASSGPFVLGVIPGATPGKWIGTWRERLPAVPLELVQLPVRDQRASLIEGTVAAALVRLPIDTSGLHVIALYDEVPVVMMSADSHLTAADELTLADLHGEIVIVPGDDIYALTVSGAVAPSFDAPTETADAVATVAAGVGVVIVPMSLARAHQRKDVAHRPLRDGPVSTVALAWRQDRATPLVDAFVGIVRGRTAQSSRD